MINYFLKKKLVKYLKRLKNPKIAFPKGYIESHQIEIYCLEWLIGSYEGRTGKPKDYLESLIEMKDNYENYVFEMQKHNIVPLSETDRLKMRIRQINFLYNWIYYKRIIGF